MTSTSPAPLWTTWGKGITRRCSPVALRAPSAQRRRPASYTTSWDAPRRAADVQVHVGYRCVARGAQHAGFCSHELPYNARPIDSVLDAIEANLNNKRILWEKGKQAQWRNAVRAALEQLRETWERAVEEFIGPVFKRLSTKVDTKNLRKLTVLEIADCDAMREGFGACSELLHSISESLNPKLPAPANLQAEITKLRDWYQGLRSRQEKIKAA